MDEETFALAWSYARVSVVNSESAILPSTTSVPPRSLPTSRQISQTVHAAVSAAALFCLPRWTQLLL